LYAPEDKREIIREQIRRLDESDANSSGAIEESASQEPPCIEQGRERKELEETLDQNLKPSSTIEYESHGAYIKDPVVLTLAGEQVNNLIRGNTYRYAYTVHFSKSAINVCFDMLIKTVSGVELGGGASARDRLAYVEVGSTYRVEFLFQCSLNPGVYFLNSGVMGGGEGGETYLHRLIDIAMFRVQADSGSLATGIVDFGCNPEIELLQA
jgi:lipopolysaccharide transport system ATP-binding protein